MTQNRRDSSSTLLIAAAAVLVLVLWALRDIVLLLGFALLLAYVLDPVVTGIERLRLPRRAHVPRPFAAALVMVVLLVVLGWALALAAPRLAGEIGRFVDRAPGSAEQLLAQARAYALAHGLSGYLDPAIDSMKANAPGLLRDAALGLTRWIGRLFSGLGQVLGLAVLPLLAFYLLAEREAVQASAMQFVPEQARGRLDVVTAAVDRALRSYVRGQGLVCLIMGSAVGLALAVLGFPLALLLGLIVGLAEIVPFLGALVATIAIALTGYTVSPLHALLGAAVYIAINNAIGLLVTPRVMGRYLRMHPFVVTVSVLAGARLLGPAGVMLALPAAAVIQSLVRELAPRPGARSAG
jgi:predicted PurR-regulated permease PerM